jgi:hypothetical protein
MGSSLNKTDALTLANKAGINVNRGDVVVLDLLTASAFTITGSNQLATRTVGVVLDTGGIVTGSSGLIAINGYIPQINLLSGSTIGQTIGLSSVAGKAIPHSSILPGDFGQVLGAGTTPDCILWGNNTVPTFPLFDGCSYATSAGQTFPSNTGVPINFDAVDYDPQSRVTTGANWKFTAGVTGYYLIQTSLLFGSVAELATWNYELYIMKNGSIFRWIFRYSVPANNTEFQPIAGSITLQLNAGDFINIIGKQNTASNKSLHTDGNYNWVMITRVG